MTIPAPDLDDRTFQDIVDEAKRLIPRYTPEWTNHNLSDPGVALIELFAWMSEMVLFRVNQVPDRLFVHFLNLVGITPFPPSVARADLTFWLSAVQDSPVSVPAGLQVTTVADASGDPVVFTTNSELLITQPTLRAALTTDAEADQLVDVYDDLRFPGASVVCFTSVGERGHLIPGDCLILGFAESLAGMALRLSFAATARGIGVDPARPPLAWEVWNGEAWIATDVFSDSTGGLNRAGEVVLMVGPEHELLTLGRTAAYWLRVRLLQPAPGQPTYQESPRIEDLAVAALGATVAAEHSSTAVREVLGRSDGSPGQEFVVGFPPVLPRRAGETVVVTDAGNPVEWTEVEDFSRSTATDPHFVWESTSGVVRFGPRLRYPDGSVRQHGRIPRDGTEIAVSGYRHGGGSAGNVGSRTLTVMRSAVPYVSGVVNLRGAVGGVDGESVAEAKIRGPLTLRTGQRAVTAGDFERLTLESSIEVARARCLPSATPGGPVRLLVVPAVRTDPATHQLDDFALSAPLLRRITEHLDAHRIVGTAVEVGTPFYQGVSIAALVHAPAGRPMALVRQRAMAALTRYIHPLTGGADAAGWLFDADLNAAALAQLLESVEGIDRVDEVQLFEYDLRTGRRIGAGRDMIRLDRHSLFLSGPHRVVVR
ncbi:putative baseplate assembly protein [Nakamurella lactea]|uniref:putative baseplate assembly protein n=1 Tax=Nakamurella lactea TaxID=459515 RepID=UPI00042407E6|nr:putative baseplate assembly protein [Nakamurella lactea]